jgi:hypothetical protein
VQAAHERKKKMKSIRNQMVALSLSIMAAAVMAQSAHSAPASPPGPDVRVVNTPTNPVPVVQQGPVSIAPGSSVKISTDSPVPVKVTLGQIVRISAFLQPTNLFSSTNLYIVPVGKRLLISDVNVMAFTEQGRIQVSFPIQSADPQILREFAIPLADQSLFTPPSFTDLRGSAKTQIVVEAGETLTCRIGVTGNTTSVKVLLTGTLVDATDPIIDVYIQAP